MARILSQKSATTPGRPGHRILSRQNFSGKLSDIRILKRNIPADGVNQDTQWSETEDIVGDPSPRVLTGSQRKGVTNPSTSDSRTRVRDRSVDRDVDVR